MTKASPGRGFCEGDVLRSFDGQLVEGRVPFAWHVGDLLSESLA